MANWIISRTVDLQKPDKTRMKEKTVVLMVPGDNQAHVLQISVYDNGSEADLSEYSTASGFFVRTDMETVACEGTIVGNVVSITFANECYACSGALRGVVRIANSDGTRILSLLEELFFVSDSLGEGFIDGGSTFMSLPALTAAMVALQGRVDSELTDTTALVAALRGRYKATTLYSNTEDITQAVNTDYDLITGTGAYSDYDELEVFYDYRVSTGYSGSMGSFTVRVSEITGTGVATVKTVDIANSSTDSQNAYLGICEADITFATASGADHSTFKLSRLSKWKYTSSASIAHESSTAAQDTSLGRIKITKIIGFKLAEDAEIADARTGFDEMAYQTLGAAIRSQILQVLNAVVRFDAAQTLTDAQKEQARSNIGAASAGDIPTGTVRYDASQSLTSAQKTQARSNIGAAASSDIQGLVESVTESEGTVTITKKNGQTTSFVIPQGLAFDGGYIDPDDNTLHLTLNGVDIEGFEPIELPVGGPASADYDSSYYLHFYDANGDEMLGGPFLIEGGGGGGAQGYSVRIINNMASTVLTVASTQVTNLSFKYIEYYGSEVESANGLLTVQYKLSTESDWHTYITNQQIASNANQTLNITSLLTEGSVTNIRLICSNGRSGDDAVTKTLQYNITSVAMSISTTFNSAATYTGNITIPYTCVGRGLSKTVYLYIDGTEYTHVDVGTSSGQALQLAVTLAGNYAYGAHIAKLYFVTSDGAVSNELVFPILYDNSTSEDPIVGATLEDYTIENGETIYLKYVCYTPGQETTDDLSIRVYSVDTETSEETDYYSADFEDISNNIIYTLPITLYPSLGTGYIELISGETTETVTFTVTEVQTDYDIDPVTTGLVYSYRPTGYTNNSADKEEYVYALTDAAGNSRNVYTEMTDFNWVTDGYLDGQALTIAGAARMNIHLPILTTSFTNDDNQTVVLDAATGATVTTSGRTIEFEFELENVTDQNSVVFSCLDSNGVGFVITPQVCYLLADGQSPVLDSTGFIENEESIPCAYIKDEKRIRVTFVIQRKRYTADNRFTSYANIFINGEYANSYLYSEDAVYNGTANITIGSADCVTKIYDVRMYNRDLSDEEVLKNRMNASADIRERIVQNEWNDILNGDGDVDYVKARKKYPCLLFIGKLSNFKNDRQYVGVVLTKPDGYGDYNTEFSLLDQDNDSKFVSSIKVQGTSSQRFMRKNFKVYLVRNDGASTKKVKYVLKGYDNSDPPQPLSIGESTLCYKADYMSTDHANTFNANIADTLFNDKPAGSLVQNTVWGFRCLLFNLAQEDYVAGTDFDDYSEGTIKFAGDGCLNNDKGNTKTFGLEDDDDDGADTLQQKWEFKDNSNPLCTFTTDRLMQRIYAQDGVTYTRQARNGLESCYPDEGDLDEAGIEPDYSHIQALFTWVYQWANFWDASTTSGTGGTYNSQSYSTEYDLKYARFKREFSWHFNMEHALVYYLFIEWVALCDNRAKNMFLSCKNVRSESILFTDSSTSIWDLVNDTTGVVDASKIDWENSTWGVWYTDLYDLDSCFGAENSGYIRIPYYADWQYKLGRTDTYQFNGHDSRLWCMFEEAFADEIKARAKTLTGANPGGHGSLNFAVLKQVHITDNAVLVCPAVVNEDMEYKYEDAWTQGYYDYSVDPENPTWTQTSAYKYLQRGSRTEQKESFIYRRSMMLYSKYQTDQFLNDRLAFRCGAAVALADTDITLSAIQAMWMGVQYGDSGSPVMSAKKAAGQTATLTSPNALGRSDNVYIMGASNLTSVSSLAEFHPYEIGLTNAGKLKTLLIGSDATGYENGDLSALDTSACALLDTLNVQGCTGFSDNPINLTANTLIREVYAGGSTVPYFTFANGGILETLELGTPKRIVLLNQPYLDDFRYDSLSSLVMLRVENTPNVGVLDILAARLADLRLGIRLIGIDETITGNDYSLFKALTSADARGKRLDANGNLDNDATAFPVITGTIHCDVIGATTLALMNQYYPNLTIVYGQLITQYTVTFKNWDDTTLFVEYIDSGTAAYDPIESGELQTPTRASTPQYIYTFDDWDSIPSAVIANTTVTATYTSVTRTYTVTWYDGVGSGNGTLLETKTDVTYGSCVQPTDNAPTYTALEGNNVFYVFKGWDKNTGYITGDTVVKATWIVDTLPAEPPAANAVALKNMNYAQIAAIAKNNLASNYWEAKDYFDVTLGRDFHFDNVEDETLVSTPVFFDGTRAPIIFNGENDLPLIQLFNGTHDRWTLAIEYEFTSASGVLASCFEDSGNQGFELRNSSSYGNVLWGNVNQNVSYQYIRTIVVIRFNRGQAPQVLYVAREGCTSADVYPYSSSHPETNCTETAHARSTTVSTNAPLTLGGVGYMNGEDVTSLRATGWIHWAKIWYDDLGSYDAKAIGNFPHIPMRFCYTPIRYRDGLESPNVVAASFLSEGPLPLLGVMNDTGTNLGGWKDSKRRAWMNGQLYDAMPIPLQSIIKPARVRSSAGNKTTDINATMDKLYLPAYAEIFSGQTDNTYKSEMDDQYHTVPWFTNNRLRVKFPGFILPDDVVYVTDPSDPTLYNGTYDVYSEKTVWINTSNSSIGYIYVDADYISKHKRACARLLTSSDNIDAQGADSNGHTGGKWVRAAYWWLRSPYLSYTYTFWIVYIYGSYSNPSYAYAASSYALVCGFSI